MSQKRQVLDKKPVACPLALLRVFLPCALVWGVAVFSCAPGRLACTVCFLRTNSKGVGSLCGPSSPQFISGLICIKLTETKEKEHRHVEGNR